MEADMDNTIDKIVLQIFVNPKIDDAQKQTKLKGVRDALRSNRHVTDHETALLNFMHYSFRDQIFTHSEVERIQSINNNQWKYKLGMIMGISTGSAIQRNRQLRNSRALAFSFRRNYSLGVLALSLLGCSVVQSVNEYRMNSIMEPIMQRHS